MPRGLLLKLEVKDRNVLADALWIAGARDRHDVKVQVPAQDDLRWSALVTLGQCADQRSSSTAGPSPPSGDHASVTMPWRAWNSRAAVRDSIGLS